ncbi:MAG TPA: N-acetylmuramoyl-L-alanine amidase, partial [Acidimicrobiales bacterium]
MADHTRRLLSASVLVAILALPGVPRVAHAAARSPAAVPIEASAYRVDDVTPPEATAPQQGLEPFVTIGVSYRSASAVDGRVRAHTVAGWTDWYDLNGATGGGDGPAATSPEAGHAPPASDPVWVGEADGFQLSLPADATGVVVHLVRPTGEAAPLTAGAATEAATGPAPTVRMREAWGARPYRGTVRLNSSLRRGLIHHTVNSNTYSRDQVPSMLRSIQAYHQDTRGWADIAYNFVVDRFGRLWEGRARSYEDPVIGSASSGDETGNVTVAFLGDGSRYTPSSTVLRSMGRLLGWKLRKHGLTPTRANIMGHRDIG